MTVERTDSRAEDHPTQTVLSADGTPIAFWRSGSGPPLLLVHGGTADHTTTWHFVLADFERRFTVYAMDRRGRGGSGDAPTHDLQREAEDVAAVVDSIGQPVSVLGHSYGALCSLEASLRTKNMRRLVLYEGVPLEGKALYGLGTIERLETLLRQGDVEGMLIAMYREVVGASPGEIEMLRTQRDAWARRLKNARKLPREMRGEQQYVFEAGRFAGMKTPTLLLVGGASPELEMQNARGVASALLDARVGILPGQQHVAMYAAPALFVNEVVAFLAA